MSTREKWEPTETERAEHETRHAQALIDHIAGQTGREAREQFERMPDTEIPTDEDLLS